MKRIIIIGSSCAGKTTLARQLSRQLDIKHIELDELHWKPGWIECSNDEFRTVVEQSLSQHEAWVMDGNYAVVRDITWAKADTIIWLNYSFPVVLYRAISRTVKRAVTKEQVCNGNQEQFWRSFLSKESIIWWVIMTYHDKKARYPKQLDKIEREGKKVLRFCSSQECDHFFQKLKVESKRAPLLRDED